ncbi:DUF1707 domain-containing protein [Streptomyces sp. DSM 41527]|uniref:DUF1707 domain-containing protein n=1 Tax=Streptomyces mooreae TaxID=3075523 RepID=A0ABU2TIR9_9ACTN|nr:DUF1707 domain-containing protein [Streptomyces sp. DSM 41527]MDT0460837.1 DUF1707 domain-containing protein [Streptomyces sp. DSM 41527]
MDADNGGRPGPENPPGPLQKQGERQERQPVNMTKPPSVHSGPSAPPAVAEGDIRASDADRDRVAEILREALAEGRLDPQEHAERIDTVYRAKTMGELEPVIRDLPAAGAGRAQPGPDAYAYGPRAPVPDQNLVAIFSASVRKGRWQAPARINAFALFGSVEIDLTEAVFPQQQVQINVTAVFGSVEIRVPENITLRSSGSGILGSFEIETHDAEDGNAPQILVNGYAVLGSVEARPKRGAWIRDLRDRVWEDHRALRHELREERRERHHQLRHDRQEWQERLRAARRERRDRFR